MYTNKEPVINTIAAGLVRPVITIMLCAAAIISSFINKEAAALLLPPAMGVIAWWFRERTAIKEFQRLQEHLLTFDEYYLDEKNKG